MLLEKERIHLVTPTIYLTNIPASPPEDGPTRMHIRHKVHKYSLAICISMKPRLRPHNVTIKVPVPIQSLKPQPPLPDWRQTLILTPQPGLKDFNDPQNVPSKMHAVGVCVHWGPLVSHIENTDLRVWHTTAEAGLGVRLVLDLPVAAIRPCTPITGSASLGRLQTVKTIRLQQQQSQYHQTSNRHTEIGGLTATHLSRLLCYREVPPVLNAVCRQSPAASF
jgi:hypothetical protein